MDIKVLNIDSSVGDIKKIIMQNDGHMIVELYSYGASIYQIYVDSKPYCVVPKHLDDFLSSTLYYGKTIGRMSGRISTAPFYVSDHTYQVAPFGSRHYQLHGGKKGFSFQNFDITKTTIDRDFALIVMTYKSCDLEEGYPGELTLDVTYTLYQDQRLTIDFDATTTKDTVANFTNHVYFNLLGTPHTISDHEFMIPASYYLDRTTSFEYLGIKAVDQRFDFRKSKKVGQYLESFDPNNPGYDHTFLLDKDATLEVDHAQSNLKLEIKTDYESVVFFTHNVKTNALNDQFPNGGQYAGFALECQHAPGGTHHNELPSLILKKDQKYHHFINYQFKYKSKK